MADYRASLATPPPGSGFTRYAVDGGQANAFW